MAQQRLNACRSHDHVAECDQNWSLRVFSESAWIANGVLLCPHRSPKVA